MVLKFLRGQESHRLERIESALQRMLTDDSHSLELATSTLLDGVPPGDVGQELRETDRRVNQAEREIRRELVIHASVHGSIDTPAVLVYMSIVKDIERVGDYAKNLFDIAADGGQLHDVPDVERLRTLRDRIEQLVLDVGETFASRDTDRARQLIESSDELLDQFDGYVSALVSGEDDNPGSVARALTHRYYKRIVAHLMNVLSAVVMPVDQIDYFDEDPEDRESLTE